MCKYSNPLNVTIFRQRVGGGEILAKKSFSVAQFPINHGRVDNKKHRRRQCVSVDKCTTITPLLPNDLGRVTPKNIGGGDVGDDDIIWLSKR